MRLRREANKSFVRGIRRPVWEIRRAREKCEYRHLSVTSVNKTSNNLGVIIVWQLNSLLYTAVQHGSRTRLLDVIVWGQDHFCSPHFFSLTSLPELALSRTVHVPKQDQDQDPTSSGLQICSRGSNAPSETRSWGVSSLGASPRAKLFLFCPKLEILMFLFWGVSVSPIYSLLHTALVLWQSTHRVRNWLGITFKTQAKESSVEMVCCRHYF